LRLSSQQTDNPWEADKGLECRMNEVLRSIVSSGSVVTEDGKIRACHSGISQEEGEFFSR
jgi:hypothetical protein